MQKEKTKAKKITGIVLTALSLAVVVFLFVVTVSLAVDKFIKKSPVPSFCGVATLIVTTGSMSGTIEQGDMIIVKKSQEFKIGDIITFIRSDETVPTTHRIIRMHEDKIYTKGDANNAEDARPISQSDVVGKVTGRVKHVGLFFTWLKEEFGWAYIVAAVGVIVAGVMLYKAASKPTPADPSEKKEK